MAKPRKKVDLRKLQKEWYAKLAKEGFRDIERNPDRLHTYHSDLFAFQKRLQHSYGGQQCKADYYALATSFLNEYKFERELDKIIWEYHAEGISARDISRLLAKAKVANIQKTRVWELISNLEHRMKLMYLTGYREDHGA